MPVYDEKYIKAKVREFNGVIQTNFLGDEIPKENVHYTCIVCITIDSVMRMEKKNYPQVYLSLSTIFILLEVFLRAKNCYLCCLVFA